MLISDTIYKAADYLRLSKEDGDFSFPTTKRRATASPVRERSSSGLWHSSLTSSWLRNFPMMAIQGPVLSGPNSKR